MGIFDITDKYMEAKSAQVTQSLNHQNYMNNH